MKNSSDIRCSRCKVQRPVDGLRRCQRCIDQGIAYKQQKYKEAKATGACARCFKETANGVAICAACNEANKRNSEKLHNSRKKAGRCVICGGENNTTTLKCSACAKRINQGKKQLTEKRIKEGFCSRCRKVPVTGGRIMCPTCRTKKKIRKAKARQRDYVVLGGTIKKRKTVSSNIYGFIYKVVCEANDKIYIGQSVNFKARKSEHVRNARNAYRDTAFTSALRKHGPDKFNWEIIHACADKDELNYWERHYINQYDSLCGKNGYNILDGVVN